MPCSASAGGGFLTGKIAAEATCANGELRNVIPRFTPMRAWPAGRWWIFWQRWPHGMAPRRPGVALAWLRSRKTRIVPLPGSTKRHRLEEDVGGAVLALTA